MPIDRTATLRNAEKLLRQGKLSLAIAEYLRVVEEDPRDWNTANLLGDLYLRAGSPDKAVDQFIRIADNLSDQGFLPKAAALYKKILKIKPDDEHALLQSAELARNQGLLADARACLNAVLERRRSRGDDQGVAQIRARLASLDPEDVAPDLTVESAGDDPGLLLKLAEIQLRAGRIDEGMASARRLLATGPSGRQDVALLGFTVAEQAPDAGFQVIELVVGAASAQSDWPSAAAALQEFVTRVPHHVPALMRLVEVSVDGELEATMYGAQAQLADAYLAAGAGAEAAAIAEDLVVHEPWERANIERFRRALVMMGEADPDAVIAERLSGQTPFMSIDPFAADASPGVTPAPAVVAKSSAFELSAIAIDLDSILGELESPLETPAVDGQSDSVEPADLESVFARMRDDASRRSALEGTEEEFGRALALYQAGEIDASIPLLESASRAPGLRFATASLLARIYRERELMPQAIEWFERAAEAPAATAEEGWRLLYELADALESVGEAVRALAIFMELQTEAGAYRDVAARVDRLSKAQARG